jgi:hypothetical protein
MRQRFHVVCSMCVCVCEFGVHSTAEEGKPGMAGLLAIFRSLVMNFAATSSLWMPFSKSAVAQSVRSWKVPNSSAMALHSSHNLSYTSAGGRNDDFHAAEHGHLGPPSKASRSRSVFSRRASGERIFGKESGKCCWTLPDTCSCDTVNASSAPRGYIRCSSRVRGR